MNPLPRRQLSVVPLEDRTVPATLIGLTTDNALITFDSGAPGTIVSSAAVTGLGGENLLAIDFRPSNGVLYGVTSGNRIVTIDQGTGVATAVGTTFTPGLTGANFGFDFNPAVDKLRLVSESGQNLRLNPATGAVVGVDTPLAYDAASFDAFVGGTAPAPRVVAEGYTLNRNPVGNAVVTTLYGIDANTNLLVTQGGPESDPNPNLGQLFVVGALNFDATEQTGFDIETGTDNAFATRVNGGATEIYSVNLATAASTLTGTVPGRTLRGVSIQPAFTGAGTVQFTAAAFSFAETRGPLAVTVTRTGGSTGTATVDFATVQDAAVTGTSAIAGTDFLPTNGTLTFAEGQTSQTIFLQVPAGTRPTRPATTFNLVLSNATVAAGGATTTATITIPATTPDTVTGRVEYFAAAAGAGAGPRVDVFNSLSGTVAFSFFAFEPTFTGGLTVATADVNGDAVDDIVVGAGVSGGPRILVFDGATRNNIADFFAYEPTFRGGVLVAAGDVNGDGFDDIIAGTGVGGGPRVRVLDGATISNTTQGTIADFFAYEDSFRGGVFVAAGEFTGDNKADVVAGAGDSGGPRVRIFDSSTSAFGVVNDYFAYDSGFRSGVFVSTGDVNGDGRIDVVTGTGPRGGPDLRTFSGSTNTPVVPGFFAFDSNFRGGVRVTTNDFDANGTDEIIAAQGPGGTSQLRVFSASTGLVRTIDAFEGSVFSGGLFVG